MSVTQHFSSGRVLSCGLARLNHVRRGFRPAAFIIFCLALLYTTAASAVVPNAVPPKGTYDGENVKQPIEFPHNIHVKINKINCMYCHTYARRSKVAGIPPTSKCMGCHSVIATDRDKSKSPIKELLELADAVHDTLEKEQAPKEL